MNPRPAALLLLPTLACAVGPNYTKPQIPVPKTWTEAMPKAANAESLARWWTEFQDPTLDRLVKEAVEGNLDLKIAAARIREARAARGIAASAGRPQVGANAAYARTQRSEGVFEAGFDASWEIDVFGGVRRDKEAALADVQAAEEGRREALVTLLADVGRSYLELRGTQQQLRILEETLASQRDTLDLAKARFEAGLGTELDVARAEGLLKANEAERPILERQTREAIYRLGVLLGREPSALANELETPADIPPIPPEIPMTLPSELLSRRPDLKQAERELAAATARIGVARADLFPRFSILGSFGRRSEDAGDLKTGTAQFWNIIPAVRWPIFSGGRIRTSNTTPVALVSETLAERWFPGEDPIGRRIDCQGNAANPQWREIVGIVGDVRDRGLDRLPELQICVPYAQRPTFGFWVALHTEESPLASLPMLRAAVARIDPDLPVQGATTMERLVAQDTRERQVAMAALTGFPVAALLLSALGLYGLVAQTVRERVPEVGLRMALGAGRARVTGMVLAEGARLAAGGLVCGFLVAAGSGRLVRGLLFGVSVADPLTYGAAGLVLLATALVACAVPAARAARVDPARALRAE